MTLSRIFLVASVAFAATAGAAMAASGFTVAPADGPRSVIMVIDSAAGCSEAGARARIRAQAALAAAAGGAIGVVASGGACGAAQAVMDAAPDLAFARDSAALGPRGEPNSFLAANRDRGIYVWDLGAYRRLSLPASRDVLGVFAGESPAAMIGAALDRLSRDAGGYFLLVQADTLDAPARAALEAARLQGAEIIAPGLVRNASFSALD